MFDICWILRPQLLAVYDSGPACEPEPPLNDPVAAKKNPAEAGFQ
jgi:hypothetical protein